MKKFFLIVFLILDFFVFAHAAINENVDNKSNTGEAAASPQEKWWNDFSLKFNAGLGSEESFATAKNILAFYDPLISDDEVMLGYFLGMSLNYRPDRFFDFFVDGNIHRAALMVGAEGSRLKGAWVFNESGLSESPPLEHDVYFTAHSTFIRLGVRGIYPINPNIELWAGVAAGIVSWTAAFSNEEQTQYYSDLKTGLDFGFSWPLIGADFNIINEKGKSFMTFSLYFEGGRELPSKPLEFENLIFDGWEYTFSESTLILPLRFGIAISGAF